MKKIIKSLSLVICILILVSMVACNSKDPSASSKTNSETGSNAGESTNGEMKYETFKTGAGTVMPKIPSVKGKTVTFLCTDFPTFEPGGAAYKYLQTYYGITVKETKVAGAEIVKHYTQAALSGQPYDIIPSTDLSAYPSLVSQNMVEPVDDILDFSIPELAKRKHIYESYSYKNHYYVMPWVQTPFGFIYFNKEMFEDAELDIDGDGKKGDNPFSLFEEGKWDLNTFKEVAIAMTKKDAQGNVKQWGLLSTAFTDARLVYQSGEPIIKQTNGTFVNNLGNSNYQRILNQYVDMMNNLKVVKRDSEIYKTFNEEKGAMLLGPSYMTLDWVTLNISTIGKNANIGITQFPKDPNTSSYHVAGVSFGFCVGKGGLGKAKTGKVDADLANAFVCSALASQLEGALPGSAVYKEARDRHLAKYPGSKLTPEWFDDYCADLRKLEDGVSIFIDPMADALEINSKLLEPMIGLNGATPKSFSAVVKENEGAINTEIAKFN